MAKNRNKVSKNTSQKKAASNNSKQKPIRWLAVLQKLAVFLVISTVVIISFVIYINNEKEQQDLSVIGNGTATVVQIHDPGCRLCNQLKGNLDAVKGDFTDRVQFKTAMIVTKQGQAFANQHGVQHVTLLFFNEQGRRVHTLQGVSSKSEIRRALKVLVN